MPRFWSGRRASISAAVELAAVRAWSRTKASAWLGLRLAGGTVVEGGRSPGLVVVEVAPEVAAGVAGSTMVFCGRGMSLVSGADHRDPHHGAGDQAHPPPAEHHRRPGH
ncbi:MAG TPA: hypothetical protein VNT52_16765, partial [Acidimicrobiales bacterium]|nr:hypothetical protein [Acidimicrobiales bacterium]